MSFIDSYKRLEKLCSEIYGDNHGISSYIDEMLKNPVGARYVRGWDEDLKQLKHYRWIRNTIVHEPGCTEDNMCDSYDVQWLNNFHSRIMSRTDPIALYRKARNSRTEQKPKQMYTSKPNSYTSMQPKSTPPSSAGCLTLLIVVLLAITAVVLLINVV